MMAPTRASAAPMDWPRAHRPPMGALFRHTRPMSLVCRCRPGSVTQPFQYTGEIGGENGLTREHSRSSRCAEQCPTALAMEVLSIVAYRQPITRSGIELIRGSASDSALDSLLERGLIEHNQHHLLITTTAFLKYLGLRDLADLPALPNGVFTQHPTEYISGVGPLAHFAVQQPTTRLPFVLVGSVLTFMSPAVK
ncbi:MAG: SMC-Scp complex subunit ScpB [Chloroflexi bacterium]|nr:SMC-Scp complex subunit ScpB [Chloroflexota bacterium]